MSFELVNTFATLGTFVVIAATAIAAIVQLRHMRGSNHIAALNELRETMETADFLAAQHFVLAQMPAKLQDPAFRHQVATVSARSEEIRPLAAMVMRSGNFYESMGVLVKTGLVDKDFVLEMWSGNVLAAWKNVSPLIALLRRAQGDGVYENFELLAVMAEDFHAAHPAGTYPRGVRRMEPDKQFLEADKQYAASLAPA